MKASEIDKKFDAGENVLEHFDLKKGQRLNQEAKRVNVDFPAWMVESLDQEAKRVGVTRQSVIKMWIAERLEDTTHGAAL